MRAFFLCYVQDNLELHLLVNRVQLVIPNTECVTGEKVCWMYQKQTWDDSKVVFRFL